jgi:hypothetical protein
MASPECERAIEDATRYGKALLKFISRNDAGVTGSHQSGFHLPKPVWHLYTPHEPIKGQQNDEAVEITWQNGQVTQSRIIWYGRETRAEYRLTRFGRDFPYLNADVVGSLLVLIPLDHHHFHAYVLDRDEDIEEIQTALGVEPFEHWGVYEHGAAQVETDEECVERRFQEFAKRLKEFPSGELFSSEAIAILEECRTDFHGLGPDDALMEAMKTEYGLFKTAERQLCQAEIIRTFTEVDNFLNTAARIMNRRKARAGRSLENHVHYLLTKSGVPHVMRPADVPGRPDIVIPSVDAYLDEHHPVERLFVVGVKTTCKDRWRQVLNEGRRVSQKHIITMQPGISSPQLQEMRDANVTLVVPERLHNQYPPERPMELLTLAGFVETIQRRLS